MKSIFKSRRANLRTYLRKKAFFADRRRQPLFETLEDRRLLAVVSHWTANNTAADSVGTNHGSLISGTTYAAGQVGQAFKFDGIDDRVQMADSPSLALTHSMTIEAWVKADAIPAAGQQGEILFRGDDRGGLDPYSLSLQPNGMLRFEVVSGPGATNLWAPIPVGQFVHVVGTLDDATGQMNLYINGGLISQTVTTVRPFGALDPASNPGIGIGNHGGYPNTPHNFPFNGLIDDLKLYDEALSVEQVLTNFNATKGSLEPSVSIDDAAITEGLQTTKYLGNFANPITPSNMVYGPDGNLYVSTLNGNSVLRYDATGLPLPAPGKLGAEFVSPGAGGLSVARKLAFGPDGNLYVASEISNAVLRFDSATGDSLGALVTPGSAGLDHPRGLLFHTDGFLYVTSVGGSVAASGLDSVLRFNSVTGAPAGISGQPGDAVFILSGSGGLDNPSQVAFHNGEVYVASTSPSTSNSILRYRADGTFLSAFVPTGSGGLAGPSDFVFRDGSLFVVSWTNNKVLRYDGTTGAYLNDVVSGNGLVTSLGILFEANGNFLVTSRDTNEIRRYGDSSDAQFTVRLNAPFPTTVSVNFATANGTAIAGSDYTAATGTITFAPGQTSRTILIQTLDDTTIEGNETFFVNLTNPVGVIVDGQGVGTIVDNDGPQTLFYDSFEVGEWNGLWVEDSQNDWFRSTQRAKAGSWSAEVDGSASNATLTTANALDLSGMGASTLSFDWLIESGFDAGEFLSLDISTNGGASWIPDVRRLNGNVSQENVWHSETVDLTPYASANLKVRFRSTASLSDEDANVDNVRIVGTLLGPNTPPVASAGGPYAVNEGNSIVFSGAGSSDPDGTIVSYAWDFDSDGQYDDGSGVAPSFAQTNSGNYLVGLQVTDNRGATSTTTASVTVNNVAPTANAGSDQNGFVGTPLSLSAAASSDPGYDIVSYAWDLDSDGQYDDASGVTASFIAAAAGTYTIGLRVTDADGANATDLTIITITQTLSTKFYVVNDASTNRTYEYDALGGAIENYAINSGNSAPRGAASNVAGDKVWVADKNRKVYVYNPSGGLLGSWSAGTLASNATVEGLATNGTDVWIVDSRSDKVYRYSGAASRTTGSQTAVSSFSLNSGNTSPKGIVTDGTHLWVVNDSSTDKVFKYTLNGTLVGSWTIDSTNKLPTGLTIDPSGGSQSIWIVDSGTDKVYEYANARAKTSGSQSASATFSLAAGNTNPQGIADPPSSVANVQQANTAAAPVATSNVSIPSPAAIDLALAQLPADFVRKQSDSTFVTDRYQRGDHEVSLAKPLAMNGVVSLTTQQSTRLAQSEQRTAPQSKRTTSTTAGREAFAANVDSLFADEASLMP